LARDVVDAFELMFTDEDDAVAYAGFTAGLASKLKNSLPSLIRILSLSSLSNAEYSTTLLVFPYPSSSSATLLRVLFLPLT